MSLACRSKVPMVFVYLYHAREELWCKLCGLRHVVVGCNGISSTWFHALTTLHFDAVCGLMLETKRKEKVGGGRLCSNLDGAGERLWSSSAYIIQEWSLIQCGQ